MEEQLVPETWKRSGFTRTQQLQKVRLQYAASRHPDCFLPENWPFFATSL